MSEIGILTIVFLGGYLSVVIAIGWIAHFSRTRRGFVIGQRSIGLLPTIGSLSTSFRDGSGVVFWIGMGITSFYAGVWLLMGVIAAGFVMAFIGPRIRDIAIERGYVSVSEVVRDRLGLYSEKVFAAIIMLGTLCLASMQIAIAGHMLADTLKLDPLWTMSGIGIFVGYYLFEGGYGSVIKTDVLQFFIILGLGALPVFMPVGWHELGNLQSITTLPLIDNIALFLIGFLYIFATADSWQRVFSARSNTVIRLGFPFAGVMVLIMTFSLLMIGLGAKSYGVEADTNLLFQITNRVDMTPLLQAFFVVAVAAICMSTLDTSCYVCSSTMLKTFAPIKSDDRMRYIRMSRISLILLVFFCTLAAHIIGDVVNLLLTVISLLFISSPALLYSVLFRSLDQVRATYRRKKADKKLRLAFTRMDIMFCSSMIIALICFAFLAYNGYINSPFMALVPGLISLSLCAVSFLADRLITLSNMQHNKAIQAE